MKPDELEKTGEHIAEGLGVLGALVAAGRKLFAGRPQTSDNTAEVYRRLAVDLSTLSKRVDELESVTRAQLTKTSQELEDVKRGVGIIDERLKGEHAQNSTKADLTLELIQALRNDIAQIRDHVFKLATG